MASVTSLSVICRRTASPPFWLQEACVYFDDASAERSFVYKQERGFDAIAAVLGGIAATVIKVEIINNDAHTPQTYSTIRLYLTLRLGGLPRRRPVIWPGN